MRGKKLKKRKMMMFGIATLIAVLNVSMYSGNSEREKVVLVRGEIDINKPLGEQLEQFTTVEMKKNDSKKMGNAVVRSLGELTDKRIAVPLAQGSPVPKAVLLDSKGLGQFASETNLYQTVYRINGGVSQLPKGIKSGDEIDIIIMTTSTDTKKEKRLDVFMRNVEIQSVTEADVYVKVSQNEFNKLVVASELGKFILQLPGKKEVPNCNDLSEDEKLITDCYKEVDKPGTVKSSEILSKVQSGEIINQDEIDEAEKKKRLKSEQKLQNSNGTENYNVNSNSDSNSNTNTSSGSNLESNSSNNQGTTQQVTNQNERDALINSFDN